MDMTPEAYRKSRPIIRNAWPLPTFFRYAFMLYGHLLRVQLLTGLHIDFKSLLQIT